MPDNEKAEVLLNYIQKAANVLKQNHNVSRFILKEIDLLDENLLFIEQAIRKNPSSSLNKILDTKRI